MPLLALAPGLVLDPGLAPAPAPGVVPGAVLPLAPGLGGSGAAKAVPGTANGSAGRDSRTTAATGARRLPVFVWEAGTQCNVPGAASGVAPPFGRIASARPEPAVPAARRACGRGRGVGSWLIRITFHTRSSVAGPPRHRGLHRPP
ncbi:hypothetical protein GCM10018782_37690 [Streptomyces griseoaurantiacus]|nr:hypothetical protein GCM10018782_37690 [Streptomyces griseoaurantiacus]